MNTTTLPTYQPTPVDTALPVMAIPGSNVEMVMSDVAFQIYPLIASMARLTAFCDLYLNFINDNDRPPFFFRPALPYVLLQIVDYGRMAIEWQNEGWFGANELCFTIPLERYRRHGNEIVFMDFATITPFIFADNTLSVRNGREVYGWPKIAMKMDRLAPQLDPLEMSPIIRLRLEVPGTPRMRKGDESVPFLDVVREAGPFQSLRRSGSDIFTAGTNALAGSMSLLSDAARTLGDLGNSRAREINDLGFLHAASDMGFEYLRAIAPGMMGDRRNMIYPQPIGYTGNVINLKQFRDAQSPGTACYQAITLSKMTLERINDAGLLLDLKAGDPPSGRYLLRLFQLALQPIVETLGLEVAGHMSVDDRDVAVLEPHFPFWMNADLSYGQGDTLCWRSRCSSWSVDIALPAPPPPDPNHPGIPYVPLGSGALQEIAGPFTFPTLTIRVLPMIADEGTLGKYCQNYLKGKGLDDIPFSLEPWGRHVYLLASTYDALTASLNGAGLTADREVAIAIPIKIRTKKDGKLFSHGLLPAYTFVGSQVSAITDREVYGRPTLLSHIDGPPSRWMDFTQSPDTLFQPVLEVRTSLLPSNYIGAEVTTRMVLEVGEGQVLANSAQEDDQLLVWAHTLLRDYRLKLTESVADGGDDLMAAKCAILSILFSDCPIYSVALKQFMDADNLLKACFQGLVQLDRSIESVYEIGEFVHPLHVSIPKYKTLPIVEKLGLQVKWTDVVWDPEIGDIATEYIEPIRPFWIKVAMSGKKSENLCLRAGTETVWHTNECCKGVPDKEPEEACQRLPFGPGLFDRLRKESKGRSVKLVADEWLREQLASELLQIMEKIGADPFESKLKELSIRVRVPHLSSAGVADHSWAAFVSSFQLNDLVKIIDAFEKSGLVTLSSDRCPGEALAAAIAQISPQTALESFLSEDWIYPPSREESGGVPYPVRSKLTIIHHEKGHLEPFRIRRDSAGPYFQVGKTGWTGATDASKDKSWYWEDIGNGEEPENDNDHSKAGK